MNRTLIGALDTINNLLAFIIIIGCTVAGFVSPMGRGENVPMAVLGLIGGTVLAAIICGLLAILIEIEKHLRKLAIVQEKQSSTPS